MKVEVDTDKLREEAEEELRRARERHAEAIRLIEVIENLPHPRSVAASDGPRRSAEEWNGIRNAIRAFGRDHKVIKASEVHDFIGVRYSPPEQKTVTQVASAMRKMMVLGELNRISAGTAYSEATYEVTDKIAQGQGGV